MAVSTNDLKNGMSLDLPEGLMTVVEFQHVRPGKGGAFVRTKLRNVRTGGVLERTFNAGVRVEQIYTAFARFLPPTVPDARPTVVYLAANSEDYRKLLGPLGQEQLLNPAVFDPQTNRILCGSDLRRLGEELQSALIHHSQELAALAKYEADLRKLYKGPELGQHLEVAAKERRKVNAAGVGPSVRSNSRRCSASATVGRWPAGTHHSTL